MRVHIQSPGVGGIIRFYSRGVATVQRVNGHAVVDTDRSLLRVNSRLRR